MPFIGLLDEQKTEISVSGYHRLDLSVFNFRISPQRDDRHNLTFINFDPIAWTVKARWSKRVVYFAVYDDVTDDDPIIVEHLNLAIPSLYSGDTILIAAGNLAFDSTLDEGHLIAMEKL
jgi:hypothetical protein